MTSAERLARLAAPSGRRITRRPTTGDGDLCPLDSSHGSMLVLRLTFGQSVIAPRQYCPHQSHDGSPSRPAERASWPFDIEADALSDLVTQERARLASGEAK